MCNVFCPFLVSVYLYCEGYKTIKQNQIGKGTDNEIQQSKRTRKTKAGGKMFRKKFRKIQDEKELLDG